MKILDYTDQHPPTLMKDVYAALTGKEVSIGVIGSYYVQGNLEAYNGAIIKIVDGEKATYIPIQNVASISETEST